MKSEDADKAFRGTSLLVMNGRHPPVISNRESRNHPSWLPPGDHNFAWITCHKELRDSIHGKKLETVPLSHNYFHNSVLFQHCNELWVAPVLDEFSITSTNLESWDLSPGDSDYSHFHFLSSIIDHDVTSFKVNTLWDDCWWRIEWRTISSTSRSKRLHAMVPSPQTQYMDLARGAFVELCITFSFHTFVQQHGNLKI